MNEETTDSMKTYNNLMAAPLLSAFLPELLWRTMVTMDTPLHLHFFCHGVEKDTQQSSLTWRSSSTSACSSQLSLEHSTVNPKVYSPTCTGLLLAI